MGKWGNGVNDGRAIVSLGQRSLKIIEAAKMQFEEYLPAKCPPADAIPGPKLLFRLTTKSAIAESDFQTTHEENKFKDKEPCQRCSISTLATEEAAKDHRRLIPFLKNRKIAKGTVPEGAGVLKHTPTEISFHHWSWWPAKGIARHSFFEILDEAA